ncbi:MAG: tetratricopeptide repeat protein [Fibrella sp.]|nr:tetratricopeptide repeat protein [Armatimonadota bacterium]
MSENLPPVSPQRFSAATPLPTGTVTFLFTDMEGSTKLWEQYPEAMKAALLRHDALMRGVIEANGGVIFKTIGDAFCAAFPTAPDALAAAVEAQLSLFQERWTDDVTVRVRMSLHTGMAEERDNDYFGPVLNRVARLLSAGHGGQTLVSASSYELVRDHLPEGVELRDYGAHRLKDLERPEQVYGLVHVRLPDSFPPLRSLDHLPNNLPQQLTSFVGREKEMTEVRSRLGKTHLLTLVGAGGTGKTRLAQQLAADVLDEYPDGVWLVELAPLTNAVLVAQTVAQVLGIKDQPGQTIEKILAENLKSKRLLLLMDNCEHLISACAVFTATLLRSCPDVQVLATSREPLGVAGEQVYRVPSLSLPNPKQKRDATAQGLNQYESVRLFIDRALSVKPDFAVTNSNAPALAELCHRLDGIPLALELAAARAPVLSVEEINSRLGSRFRLLTGGDRSALPRQQTLRALVDWSYDLLSEQERTLLARLSVFSGGWTLQAAEAVCGFDPIEEFEVLDLLTSLVDKSLVLTEEEGGATRYRMLETLRQYATEKRDGKSGVTALLRRRHRGWFLALAEKAESQLRGPDQAEWLSRLETEHDNLRSVLDWGATDADVTDAGTDAPGACLRLAGALWRFWYVRGYMVEGREHLARALRQAHGVRTAAAAKVLHGTATMTYAQGDYNEARSLHEESLSIRREVGDEQGIADSLYHLGFIARDQGDYAAARSLYEESLGIHRKLGTRYGIANSLNSLGDLSYAQGDYVTARSQYEESHVISRELGNKHGIANSLSSLGSVVEKQGDYAAARSLHEESLAIRLELGDKYGIAGSIQRLGNLSYAQGDYVAAQSRYEESLAIYRELGNKQGVVISLNNLGDVAHNQGDYVVSRSLYEESLTIGRDMGDKQGIAYSLEGLACVFSSESNLPKAVALWAAADRLRETIGAPLSPDEQAKQNERVEQCRVILGTALFATSWAEGRDLTWEQAVRYALEVSEP